MPSHGHRFLCASLGTALVVGSASVPRSARAHIDLLEPSPRVPGLSADPNANLKQAPCGQEQNGRTRNVHVFEPGETIRVRWDEFVSHRSYYRVAFDVDGDDDFPTFPGPGTSQQGDDPTRTCPVDGRVILAYDLTDGPGGEHSIDVTLPVVECENCTLQVIQYMYDTGRPYYFQCADLALRAAAPDAGSADAGEAGAGPPRDFRAADSCSAPLPPRPRSDGGASSPGSAPPDSEDTEASDAGASIGPPRSRGKRGGGCSLLIHAASRDSSRWVAFCAALAALFALRSRTVPGRAPRLL